MTHSLARFRLWWLVALGLMPVVGCGTADLYLTNNRAFTGRIVEADENNVYLERDVRQVRDGALTRHVLKLTTVPRNEIDWVDHPGNGAIAAGLLSTALGIALVAATSGSCGVFTADVACQMSHVPLVVGVPMTFYGSFDWLRSNTAYLPSGPQPVRPTSER